RTLTSLAIGALAIAALSIDLPHPKATAPFPALAAADTTARVRLGPVWHVYADTLEPGETLSGVLARGGVAGRTAALVLDAASTLDERRVPAGMPVFVRRLDPDSTPSEVVFQLAIDHLLHVRRTGDSTWTSTDERLPWTTDTVAVGGTIDANLYQALDDSAAALLPKSARAELAWSIADIYEYRVDMSRELQPGDHFRVLFERSRGPGGAVRIGDIMAVRFTLSGNEVDAIRYAGGNGRAEYFDQGGRSMRAAFLRAPLAFRRISSVFGRRKHPILGTWRSHTGTDYAASAGTPVRAIGDGVVIFAGRKGGYGNAIDIRHRNGYVSRYGHLRGFAKGIRAGRTVTIGQTIGYVGMTGLATGPHLHFEIRVHGEARDPRVALARTSGYPVPAAERARFDSVRVALLARLDAPDGAAQLAAR
ncbi:MAG: M23 family metallopeptidase, partial [Gemmatimonadaceae bacterium]|nr:M23 family metallopeptidase [Gemmatimonadaceae bacterium]